MAETATASAPVADKTQGVRPPKPDENAFNADLVQAEKAHKASMDRLVRYTYQLETLSLLPQRSMLG